MFTSSLSWHAIIYNDKLNTRGGSLIGENSLSENSLRCCKHLVSWQVELCRRATLPLCGMMITPLWYSCGERAWARMKSRHLMPQCVLIKTHAHAAQYTDWRCYYVRYHDKSKLPTDNVSFTLTMALNGALGGLQRSGLCWGTCDHGGEIHWDLLGRYDHFC